MRGPHLPKRPCPGNPPAFPAAPKTAGFVRHSAEYRVSGASTVGGSGSVGVTPWTPVVFLLWGAHAQSKRALIDDSRHKVLVANHPSPLSALRPPLPFIGCGHFSQAREWRAAHPKAWSQRLF